MWLDILTPKKVHHPRKFQRAKSTVNGLISSDAKLERRIIMENCPHPERHTSPIGLESDAEEGKSHAPARSELQGLRIEIVDGFSMPGFHGRYFMWPEEYWLLSKYVDLTDGALIWRSAPCAASSQ